VADLHLEGVTFAYPGGLPVLREPGLTLTIGGGATALVGENGAGKTTLTKLLNGLLRPLAGRVTVAGVAVADHTVAQMARTIGYAFQNPDDQLFERTVRDEVAFGPRAMHRAETEVRIAVDRALERCGLSAQEATNPHDLGLPDRKWVTIASALAADPPVLVLDEPTLGQDWPARVRLRSLLSSLVAEGRLVLVVTHDMDFVAETCPTTVVLTHGQVRHAGPTREAFEDEALVSEAGLEFPIAVRLARALGAPPGIVGEDAFVSWWQSR
jgi:energy-coupling factor transport system ATP-binding protein